ncbi:DUF2946 domain-containing protein [Pseudomonas sp. NPDC087612]|uniref:DUF2946 domain-containing protein n=2 Tax=Pseudomonas TaxID=286 RepID=UPI000888F9A1|nr:MULTISPECIES: DUF2946 domain-containing protein [unclassified Pseudomonas]NLU59379.1 DUF2946 domain-containing protein [Pseudomonas sp. BIGb0427]QPG65037.1 DUF2946 domain-containing protein [Pseudomonas sp. BIGb0427]QVM96219.1 DUF2946 domain-containing protein [Pseudomonas sp. SORT22]SDQ17568.1 Protein of unknown function [Pseudomonas sp. UC 17F4]
MTSARSRFTRPARPGSRTLRGSWLSLFAMLMIFIGPLVSQSMPMDHRAMPPGMNMSMAMDSAADCHADNHHGGSPALKVIWEKCGYCSLFFHCPALPQALSLLNTEAVPASNRLIVYPRQGHARQTVFPGARSRAPPPFIVV